MSAPLSVPVIDLASIEATPWYGHASLNVPAAHVKQIQSGEFSDLSKLLPSSFPAADDRESVVPNLTLPYLTLPYLTLPYLTLPYLTLPYLNLR